MNILIKIFLLDLTIHRELEQIEGKVKSDISPVGLTLQPHRYTLDENLQKIIIIFKNISQYLSFEWSNIFVEKLQVGFWPV